NPSPQPQGASPQDPERRGHATRQYTVKVSLLTLEAPHPVHPAPVAHVRTRRVQEATGRQRRRMASGDAQKVWFPELIALVRQAGEAALSMDTLLRLRDRLHTTLQTIRDPRQILPALMWGPHCQARHRAAPPSVSVRATILALGRYTRATASEVQCSGRQGLNLAGESPVISIARFGYVAMPQFVEGNHTFFAWCKRPGCPMACYRAVAVGATWRPSKYGSLNMSE